MKKILLVFMFIFLGPYSHGVYTALFEKPGGPFPEKDDPISSVPALLGAEAKERFKDFLDGEGHPKPDPRDIQLGKFRVFYNLHLGSGNNGSVYVARHEDTGRLIAAKATLHDPMSSDEAEVLKRLGRLYGLFVDHSHRVVTAACDLSAKKLHLNIWNDEWLFYQSEKRSSEPLSGKPAFLMMPLHQGLTLYELVKPEKVGLDKSLFEVDYMKKPHKISFCADRTRQIAPTAIKATEAYIREIEYFVRRLVKPCDMKPVNMMYSLDHNTFALIDCGYPKKWGALADRILDADDISLASLNSSFVYFFPLHLLFFNHDYVASLFRFNESASAGAQAEAAAHHTWGDDPLAQYARTFVMLKQSSGSYNITLGHLKKALDTLQANLLKDALGGIEI